MKKQLLLLIFTFFCFSSITFAQTLLNPSINGNPRGLVIVDNYAYYQDNAQNRVMKIDLNNPTNTPTTVLTVNYDSYTLEATNDGFLLPNTGGNNIDRAYANNSSVNWTFNYIDGTGGQIGIAFQDQLGDTYFTRQGTTGNAQLRRRLNGPTSSSIVASAMPAPLFNILDVATVGPEFYFSTSNGKIWRFNRNNPSAGFTEIVSVSSAITGLDATQDFLYFTYTDTSNNNKVRRVNRSNGSFSGNIMFNLDIVYIHIVDNIVYGITSNLATDKLYSYEDPLLPVPCDAPSNIMATISGQNDVVVTWNASSNAVSYDVAYVESGQPINNATIVNTTATTQTITNLTPGVSYDIYVRTNCSAGTSNYSNSIQFRFPGRFYVDVDATGNNDGSSWSNAYTSLNTAIANSIDNDEIWVAEGIYTSTAGSAATTAFPITKTIGIYGGFDGTETQLNERDYINNKSILSGDRNQNDNLSAFPFAANDPTRTDNSRTIVNISANNVVLDGLSIQGGHNTVTQFSAIIINSNNVSNFTLTNSELAYNYVLGICSGIHISPVVDSNITITNNIIQYNSSNTGTGMYIFTQATPTVNLTIANNLFNDNRIIGNGNTFSGSAGWIRAFSAGSTINLDFVNNTLVNHKNDSPSDAANRINTVFGITQENGTMNASVSNNIFWDNYLTNSSTVLEPISSILSNGNAYGNTTVSASNISPLLFNYFPGTPGSDSNPLFTDASNNDFTLLSNSPAVDTGDNNSIPSSVSNDLAGNPRIHNTTVDLGAYEYGSSLTIDDFITTNNFKVYPNPVTSILNIETKRKVKNMTIYSVLGKEVLKADNLSIDVSQLKSGIYFLKIKDDSNSITIKKFFKR